VVRGEMAEDVDHSSPSTTLPLTRSTKADSDAPRSFDDGGGISHSTCEEMLSDS